MFSGVFFLFGWVFKGVLLFFLTTLINKYKRYRRPAISSWNTGMVVENRA